MLRKAAQTCRACPLWEHATATVFGEGAARVPLMLVGEQPGDQEDRSGHPFVGPAGRVLDEALEAAGVERRQTYVTNAVKHFKWTPDERGKRRIHQKPNLGEIAACRPWLLAEIALVRPRVIVCLGATAAQSLLGPKFRVTKQRGQEIASPFGVPVVATVHPSSLLRMPDRTARQRERARFADDLRAAAAIATR
jgi:DNA polymerase